MKQTQAHTEWLPGMRLKQYHLLPMFSIHSLVVRTLPGQATASFLLFSISPYHQFGTYVASAGSSVFPLLPHTTQCVFNLC